MRRMSFERPTDHYDERLFSIDERICALLKERKDLSNNHPGFPRLEDIANWADTNDTFGTPTRHSFFELFVGDAYDCRTTGGGGSEGQFNDNFIVSPPLPDELSGLDLVFKEFAPHFSDKSTGLEIIMHLD